MIDFMEAVLRSGTPLVYVAMAGMLAQRAGIWHLGLEGLMIIGCCASVLVAAATDSWLLGTLAAVAICLVASWLFWLAIEKLRCSPIIAGLGLTGLGLGGTDFFVQAIKGTQGAVRSPVGLPRLVDIGIPSNLSLSCLLMPLVVAALWILSRRTPFGLRLAAAGEHPFALRSVGGSPARMRLAALLLGGVLAAAGGVTLALGNLQIFSIGMTAGRGYMAFSAVIFGAAHPIATAAAALFFSLTDALGIQAQLLAGGAIQQNFVQMLPYVVTVIAITISGRLSRSSRPGGAFSELRDY